MLAATDQERTEVSEYFNSQAPDLLITFMQKVYSESVIGHRHNVWDVHTNRDRWWVITNPTNLYSQDQFPNMDLAVTFHLGLCLRIPITQERSLNVRRIMPFGEVFKQLEDGMAALSQARNVADYQAVGMRSREVLITFIGAAQDCVRWNCMPTPLRADFRGWSEVIVAEALPGREQKDRRRLIKTLLGEAWTFANWLTHARTATWHDADACISMVEYTLGLAVSLVIRFHREVPDECPDCGSRHLVPEEGRHTGDPGVVWERPVCTDCGWTGKPMPVDLEPTSGAESLIERTGGTDSEECAVMEEPLRRIRKPTDAG
ncbi:hypothetical protein CO653_33425 [Rhizobium anhuiense]|nr:hypothetical protein CO653_33425 [Rhizobium anhuiense]